MTQAWLVKFGINDYRLFNDASLLMPSIRMSYADCRPLEINIAAQDEYNILFHVIGYRGRSYFEENVSANRYPVLDIPTRLN